MCNLYNITTSQEAIWTYWRGVRGSIKTAHPGDRAVRLPNLQAEWHRPPIHPQAMLVILTRKDEIETWLTADWKKAKAFHRPLPDDGLTIVTRGDTTDQGRLFG